MKTDIETSEDKISFGLAILLIFIMTIFYSWLYQAHGIKIFWGLF